MNYITRFFICFFLVSAHLIVGSVSGGYYSMMQNNSQKTQLGFAGAQTLNQLISLTDGVGQVLPSNQVQQALGFRSGTAQIPIANTTNSLAITGGINMTGNSLDIITASPSTDIVITGFVVITIPSGQTVKINGSMYADTITGLSVVESVSATSIAIDGSLSITAATTGSYVHIHDSSTTLNISGDLICDGNNHMNTNSSAAGFFYNPGTIIVVGDITISNSTSSRPFAAVQIEGTITSTTGNITMNYNQAGDDTSGTISNEGCGAGIGAQGGSEVSAGRIQAISGFIIMNYNYGGTSKNAGGGAAIGGGGGGSGNGGDGPAISASGSITMKYNQGGGSQNGDNNGCSAGAAIGGGGSGNSGNGGNGSVITATAGTIENNSGGDGNNNGSGGAGFGGGGSNNLQSAGNGTTYSSAITIRTNTGGTGTAPAAAGNGSGGGSHGGTAYTAI